MVVEGLKELYTNSEVEPNLLPVFSKWTFVKRTPRRGRRLTVPQFSCIMSGMFLILFRTDCNGLKILLWDSTLNIKQKWFLITLQWESFLNIVGKTTSNEMLITYFMVRHKRHHPIKKIENKSMTSRGNGGELSLIPIASNIAKFMFI